MRILTESSKGKEGTLWEATAVIFHIHDDQVFINFMIIETYLQKNPPFPPVCLHGQLVYPKEFCK